MKKIIIILFTLILLLLYFCKNPDYSEFLKEYNDDIIGNIIINNNNYLLMQGLDNEYYLNHDQDNKINNNGSIFLGYDTDLLMHKTNELYIPNNININDSIIINYLDNTINYKIVNKTNKKDRLVINLFEGNKIIKKLNAIRI